MVSCPSSFWVIRDLTSLGHICALQLFNYRFLKRFTTIEIYNNRIKYIYIFLKRYACLLAQSSELLLAPAVWSESWILWFQMFYPKICGINTHFKVQNLRDMLAFYWMFARVCFWCECSGWIADMWLRRCGRKMASDEKCIRPFSSKEEKIWTGVQSIFMIL